MKRITLAVLLIAISGCSGAKPKPQAETPATPVAVSGHSEIHISYSLGHGHRKFIISADSDKVRGQTFVDRTLLKENRIDPAKYQAYLQKVSEFVERGRTPAQASEARMSNARMDESAHSNEECRMPYTITVVQGQETKKLSGCRNGDEGTVGKMIRDGEFLLFGGNGSGN